MFKKVLFFLITFFFIAGTEASNKSKIISNLKSTENMAFNFEQTINDKTENNKSSKKFDFFDLENLNTENDFIKARAESDSLALQKKFSNKEIYQNNLC